MIQLSTHHRLLGRTGLRVPPVIFGTSCLGNLYHVVPDETKSTIVAEVVRQSPSPAVFDSAGKYGAGLALETLGRCLCDLGVSGENVLISNKLGWYRIPLRQSEPTFERGVWAGLGHDAELRISYEGILQCYEQGCQLLGPSHTAQLVSVHDPDEYLIGAKTPEERTLRYRRIVDAYRALFELKARGRVQAVGIGAKDWRIIREISTDVPLDWVMFACSLTIYTHPPELLAFIAELHARRVGVINSAVFNAGFLTGGKWFNYRQPDETIDQSLFRWREQFFHVCKQHGVKPPDACVQFGLAVPGIAAVALNSEKPSRVADNLASMQSDIPLAFWRSLKQERLIDAHYPVGD